MEDTSTLALLLAAITGSSGLAGAVAWFATLRPRVEGHDREIEAIKNAQAAFIAETRDEQAKQWAAIRKLDRTLYGITTASRAVHDHRGAPSRAITDATPILPVPLDGPDESRS